MEQGKLIVLSAPSGSGKTTLVHHLLSTSLPLGFSVSATSRGPRTHEVEGVDYYFLSTEVFQQKISADAFVEYEEVYSGTFYGTYRSEIERLWTAQKQVLFDIDVKGGLNIKKQYPDQTLALFVAPPSEAVLEDRLRSRGTETEKKIQQRLAKAANEISHAKDFDLILVNDDLTLAKQELTRLVKEFLGL